MGGGVCPSFRLTGRVVSSDVPICKPRLTSAPQGAFESGSPHRTAGHGTLAAPGRHQRVCGLAPPPPTPPPAAQGTRRGPDAVLTAGSWGRGGNSAHTAGTVVWEGTAKTRIYGYHEIITTT